MVGSGSHLDRLKKLRFPFVIKVLPTTFASHSGTFMPPGCLFIPGYDFPILSSTIQRIQYIHYDRILAHVLYLRRPKTGHGVDGTVPLRVFTRTPLR